jgi:predicted RNA polymerase sigma factor
MLRSPRSPTPPDAAFWNSSGVQTLRLRWSEISDLYAMLERIDPSPLHTLNRAVAVAEWQGPEAGLALLHALAPPSWLTESYLWDAVLADLHRRAGNHDIAQRHRERALTSAPTEAVRKLLHRRLTTAVQSNARPSGPGIKVASRAQCPAASARSSRTAAPIAG